MLTNITAATNVPRSLRSVTLKGTELGYSKNIAPNGSASDWVHTPLAMPIAFDFGSLQHGWVKYPAKGSGQRAEWDMAPVTCPLADDARDGWVAVATCNVASRELNGLARLECTRPNLASAIVDLHQRYLSHFKASEDEIPIVTYQVDSITALISFKIEGWIKRTAQFGERLNPVPQKPGQSALSPLPDPEPPRREVSLPKPSNSGHDPSLIALLQAKREAAAAQCGPDMV